MPRFSSRTIILRLSISSLTYHIDLTASTGTPCAAWSGEHGRAAATTTPATIAARSANEAYASRSPTTAATAATAPGDRCTGHAWVINSAAGPAIADKRTIGARACEAPRAAGSRRRSVRGTATATTTGATEK
jgi:hypothetical protein